MSDLKELERRKFPRFNACIPLNLTISGVEPEEVLNAASINVSMNGIYCRVTHYIPLFDRILVTFVSSEHDTPAHIISQCEGIVVRVEPEHEEIARKEYHIALFFQHLSQQQKAMIQAIIRSHR